MRRKIMFISGAMLFLWFVYLFKVPPTSAKYANQLDSSAQGGIAFYVVEPGYQNTEIKLDKITPSDNLYEYNFTVSNFNETRRLETNATYNIIIRTTTNLGLEYYLYMNDGLSDILTDRNIVQDDDGTYFYVMKTENENFGFVENQINSYKLHIKFPKEYMSFEYQDILESIEIIINSSQVIN